MIGERTLYVDKVGVAGTDRIILTDQKSLAHVPMLFLTSPTTALTVGFGSGGASYSYLQYRSLKQLDCVEICPTVLDFCGLLTVANKGRVLKYTRQRGPTPIDPRYSIIIDDVRSYLRFTRKRYNIIATDCTDLRYKTNANLYDYEYFRLCRDRLTSGGMVVVWTPLGGMTTDTLQLALRTFQKVFPDFAVWYMNNEPTHYILLVGAPGPLQIDYRLMREKLKEKAVANDLRELLLDDADKLLSCYVTDGRALAADLDEGRINSENHPYLEFLSPRYGYSEQPLFDNLDWLMSKADKVETHLKPGSYEPGDLARLRKYAAAVPWIVAGHKRARQLKFDEATRDYMRASELCPEDRATSRLLDFDLLQARASAWRNDIWSRYNLGKAMMIRKRYDEAIERLKSCVALGVAMRGRPMESETVAQIRGAADLLRQIYEQLGRKREAEQLAAQMKDLPTSATGQAMPPPSR
jgi:hypothetical protein